jgi:hypothetical protein
MLLPARFFRFAVALILCFTFAYGRSSRASTIFVTTLQQKISSSGGCSLQEAIYSANADSSEFFVSGPTGNPVLITSGCVPGNGDDVIVLPTGGAIFQLNSIIDDANNPTGPTATPIITSTITIQGNGATLQWLNANLNARAFAVGTGGNLTITEMFITGFIAKGGNGASGGGGGMGAGGAIYVESGTLTVVDCTFSNNNALGGAGSTTDQAGGGGGGGLGGNGGAAISARNGRGTRGGGGGGSRGDGTLDGGGTVFESATCGGNGGEDGVIGFANGDSAPCAGGGGGGGAGLLLDSPLGTGGNGGNSSYGGGGGGGGQAGLSSQGGDGGFGGGGGAPGQSDAVIGRGSTGGKGGYGGGGAGANGFGDGHAGPGGKFAGQGDSRHGGGGAALGGAIFSHSGSVLIQNSTFAGNHVIRGDSGGGAADNGQDEGGAIFALNGSLTVQDATIVDNTSTGEGAGIIVDVEDIIVHTQQGDFVFHPPTFFTLENTILSNPSERECFYRGDADVTANGDGNLIVNNFGCKGMVTSQPPIFSGPLQLNAPGLVPTMALSGSSTNPALDAAVGGLDTDERGFPRPQGGGFDIGAYELCVETSIFGHSCLDLRRPPPPETKTLTIQASPLGAGSTDPVPGSYPEALNSVVLLRATAGPGFSFVNWSGGVADPNSAVTSVVMDQDRTVTANFAPLAATMSGNIIAKSGPSNARVWTLSLHDNGPGATNSVLIQDFTLTQTFGAACKPILKNTFPLSLGNLAPLQTGTTTVTIDFTSCASTARFTAKFTYFANSGAVSGFVSRTNQYQ